MRLTRQTNYAMRILMYCAANEGRLSRIPEIAAAYTVSELFLFKILQPLVENGLVETVRGRNGGVRLGKPAAKITLFDVVRVTEESFAMAECFENDATECPLVDSCGLNAALRKALDAFFEVLDGYSIDDLVKARPNMRSLLGIDFTRRARRLATCTAMTLQGAEGDASRSKNRNPARRDALRDSLRGRTSGRLHAVPRTRSGEPGRLPAGPEISARSPHAGSNKPLYLGIRVRGSHRRRR